MIFNIFSANFEPLLKSTNNPELIQKWKINLDAAQYENILMLTCLNLLKKTEINRHDSDSYLPTPIKDKIKWFPFPAII